MIILIEKISFISYIINFILSVSFNPGIPKRNYYYANKFEKEYKGNLGKCKRCYKCNITIPNNSKVGHCIYCNICIKNHDHHCLWIGKCVGRYNKIPFYLFIICIICYIINSIALIVNYIRIYF